MAGLLKQDLTRFEGANFRLLTLKKAGASFPGRIDPAIDVTPRARCYYDGTLVHDMPAYAVKGRLCWSVTELDEHGRSVVDVGRKTKLYEKSFIICVNILSRALYLRSQIMSDGEVLPDPPFEGSTL